MILCTRKNVLFSKQHAFERTWNDDVKIATLFQSKSGLQILSDRVRLRMFKVFQSRLWVTRRSLVAALATRFWIEGKRRSSRLSAKACGQERPAAYARQRAFRACLSSPYLHPTTSERRDVGRRRFIRNKTEVVKTSISFVIKCNLVGSSNTCRWTVTPETCVAKGDLNKYIAAIRNVFSRPIPSTTKY